MECFLYLESHLDLGNHMNNYTGSYERSVDVTDSEGRDCVFESNNASSLRG